ncbi:MAG: molecular chaperone TorD family protein, partial [Ramlibacter sp.]
MTMDTQREIAARRSQSYWLLSRLFLEQPDQPMLDELAIALRAAPAGDIERSVELAALEAAVKKALASPHEITELQVEFTRLLRGVSKVSGATEPYESVAREGRLFGECTEAVAAIYQQAGYQDLVPDAGPPDHMGTELRFMSILCFREMEAWRDGDEAQARDLLERELSFLEQHVLPWIPQLCDGLAELTTHAFYLAVATLTAAACRQDGE